MVLQENKILSGDPYNKFAIWCDQVDSWSTDRFKNGCLGYFIGGQLIWSIRSTLGVDIHYLGLFYCMEHPVEDERIFNLPDCDSYKELYEKAFPSMDSDAKDSDFRNLVSTESLSDEGYNVFLVENELKAKLIYGVKNNFNDIKGVILERGEFQRVARDIISKFITLYK